MVVNIEYTQGKFIICDTFSKIISRINNPTNDLSVLVNAANHDGSARIKIVVYSKNFTMSMNLNNILIKYNEYEYEIAVGYKDIKNTYTEVIDMVHPLIFIDDVSQISDYVNSFSELYERLIDESVKVATKHFAKINDFISPCA